MSVKLIWGDILEFLRDYREQIEQGAALPFHGALGDPPYYLGSIVERFGDEHSAPAQATPLEGEWSQKSLFSLLED